MNVKKIFAVNLLGNILQSYIECFKHKYEIIVSITMFLLVYFVCMYSEDYTLH